MTQMPCTLDQESSSYIEVFLNNKNFKKLPDDCFRSFKSLFNLDLSRNSIEDLSENSFVWLTNLERLTLNSNKLQRINSNHFRKNRNLKFLSIGWNHLKIIEEKSFLNTNLKSLILTSNFLEDLGFLVTVKSLTRIDVNENSLSLNPNNSILLKGFHELNHVSFSSNLVNSVYFVEFEESRYIRGLNLSHSNIETISTRYFITKLYLTSVDLSHNKLKYIDYNAFLLVCKLTSLYLNRNYLLQVPTLSCQNQLLVLDISQNKINSLKNTDLQNLRELKYLNVSYNNIESLDKCGLDKLNNLVYLDLSHNKIKKISSLRLNVNRLKTVYISLKNVSTNEICLLKNTFSASDNKKPTEKHFSPIILIDRDYTNCRFSFYLIKFLIYFNVITDDQVSHCKEFLNSINDKAVICEGRMHTNDFESSDKMLSVYAIQSLVILIVSIMILLFFCYYLMRKI